MYYIASPTLENLLPSQPALKAITMHKSTTVNHSAHSDSRKSAIEATGHSTVNDDEEQGRNGQYHSGKNTSIAEEIILKIPPLTVIYWCEKMTATTFGETFADFFTQTLKFGYKYTSIVLVSIFFVSLACQLKVRTYWPILFWAVMASSSIAGTCFSDFIDRTLKWGYPTGMGVLLGILLVLLVLWKLSGEHMNVAGCMNRKAEAFYWATILISNTLGTALGDFFSDSLSFGFGISAAIFGGLLVICAGLAYFTKLSHVFLFWVAFVLTRPFGATFGDFLTKKKSRGGLQLGTLRASMVILALFVICFIYEMYTLHKAKKAKEENKEQAATVKQVCIDEDGEEEEA